jgi:hypothetical protein
VSNFEYEADYEAAAEERERAADWADHVDHWRREREDALTRDRGESGNPAYATWTERVREAGYEAHDPKGASIP